MNAHDDDEDDDENEDAEDTGDEEADEDSDDDDETPDPSQTPWAVNPADWTTVPMCQCRHPIRARSQQAVIDAMNDHAIYANLPTVH